ncbi:MAG: CpsD/CapB family tyrosine-protein kinase [Candidatus Acidiferrales bacterium]|jgi:capsular exopolysaccharide synthesis family protein
MSRIHEALKKAEQERASGQIPDVPILSGEPGTYAPSVEHRGYEPPSAHGDPVAAATGGFLRFDELITRCARPTWHPDPNVNVFLNPNLTAHGAEQFRTLRSRLYQIRSAQTMKTLLVTSSIPSEGKTFVTNNLAQSIVRQPDRRVLIIDADLRCSRLHVPLGAPASPGMTDYLRGDADETKIIQFNSESNLCFIPGGTEVANPSELLSNGRLKTLLDRVSPMFDWVILDSAPLIPVADSSFLADMVDGVLMVVRAGTTPSATAQRAVQELQGRTVVGVVLNAVDPEQAYGAYYSSYGYGYGYGYGNGQAGQPKSDRVQ